MSDTIELLVYTADLLISLLQVKKIKIVTYININPKLFIKLIASKLRMRSETNS